MDGINNNPFSDIVTQEQEENDRVNLPQFRRLLATVGIVARPGSIESNNFVSGSTGWKLTAAGDLEASSGTFRGALAATSGTIGGFAIGSSTITGVGATHIQLNQSSFEVYVSDVRRAGFTSGAITFYDTDGTSVLANVTSSGGNLGTVTIKSISLSTTVGEGMVSNILPTADITYDIGASGRMFDDIWCDELHYNTLTAISDEKYKERIKPMKNRVDAFLELESREYIRKATGVVEYGFVAQEVQEKLPEAVKEYTDEGGGKSLGIDMMALFAISLQAIQKLSHEVEALKSK